MTNVFWIFPTYCLWWGRENQEQKGGVWGKVKAMPSYTTSPAQSINQVHSLYPIAALSCLIAPVIPGKSDTHTLSCYHFTRLLFPLGWEGQPSPRVRGEGEERGRNSRGDLRNKQELDDLLGPGNLWRLCLSSFGEPVPNPTIKNKNEGQRVMFFGIFWTGPMKIAQSRALTRIPHNNCIGCGELLRTFLST